MKNNIPEPGDIIYIDSRAYCDSPWRDVVGGKVQVKIVSKQEDTYWITVEGAPQSSYNWSYLAGMQDYLKERFRDNWSGRPSTE